MLMLACSASPRCGPRAGATSRASGSATMVVALLWALGGSTPFFHIVYALVPGTKFFRAPSTII